MGLTDEMGCVSRIGFEPNGQEMTETTLEGSTCRRNRLVAATGTKKLPTLKLPDGTVISTRGRFWLGCATSRSEDTR